MTINKSCSETEFRFKGLWTADTCIAVSVLISRVVAMGLVYLIMWNSAISWLQEESELHCFNKMQHGTRTENLPKLRFKSGQLFASTFIESEKDINSITLHTAEKLEIQNDEKWAWEQVLHWTKGWSSMLLRKGSPVLHWTVVVVCNNQIKFPRGFHHIHQTLHSHAFWFRTAIKKPLLHTHIWPKCKMRMQLHNETTLSILSHARAIAQYLCIPFMLPNAPLSCQNRFVKLYEIHN